MGTCFCGHPLEDHDHLLGDCMDDTCDCPEYVEDEERDAA